MGSGAANRATALGPLWVKMRRTQSEHISSLLHLKADIRLVSQVGALLGGQLRVLTG